MNRYEILVFFPVIVAGIHLFQNDIQSATFAMTCAIWALVFERTIKINGKKF